MSCLCVCQQSKHVSDFAAQFNLDVGGLFLVHTLLEVVEKAIKTWLCLGKHYYLAPLICFATRTKLSSVGLRIPVTIQYNTLPSHNGHTVAKESSAKTCKSIPRGLFPNAGERLLRRDPFVALHTFTRPYSIDPKDFRRLSYNFVGGPIPSIQKSTAKVHTSASTGVGRQQPTTNIQKTLIQSIVCLEHKDMERHSEKWS